MLMEEIKRAKKAEQKKILNVVLGKPKSNISSITQVIQSIMLTFSVT